MIISGQSVEEKRCECIVFEMVRDEQGKLVKLEELKMGEGVQAESPLMSAFVAGFMAGWGKAN